jgi:hypothetical protein
LEAGDALFVPRDQEQITTLMQIFLLEKAVYELGYESITGLNGWLFLFRGYEVYYQIRNEPIRGMNENRCNLSGQWKMFLYRVGTIKKQSCFENLFSR